MRKSVCSNRTLVVAENSYHFISTIQINLRQITISIVVREAKENFVMELFWLRTKNVCAELVQVSHSHRSRCEIRTFFSWQINQYHFWETRRWLLPTIMIASNSAISRQGIYISVSFLWHSSTGLSFDYWVQGVLMEKMRDHSFKEEILHLRLAIGKLQKYATLN